MTTLSVELPDHLATEITSEAVTREQLQAFLASAITAWLRRRRSLADEPKTWDAAFHTSAVDFVDSLIDDNQELFEELARQ